jgi:hypothetical protein
VWRVLGVVLAVFPRVKVDDQLAAELGGVLLATAKEQTKGASEDERNAKAGEKPEQVWGYNSN